MHVKKTRQAMALATLALCANAALATTLNLKYVDLRRDASNGSTQAIAPQAVNDQGVSVGTLNKSVTVFDRTQFKFVTYEVQTPVKWSAAGAITSLKLPTGTLSSGQALAIHASGAVAGQASGLPAVWSPTGTLTTLDTRIGQAYALNGSGDVVGQVTIAPPAPPMPTPLDLRRAVLWHNGVAQDLHELIPGAMGSRAMAVNTNGTVGVETLGPTAARPVSCQLILKGVSQRLSFADDTACYVAGIADDDSILIEHYSERRCDASNPPVCPPSRHHFALWRQGVATDFQADFAEITPDGTVWLQTGYSGNVTLTRWRNGVSEPVTLNITGLPSGTTPRYIPAFSSKGYMLWDGDVTGGKTVTQRHGLLTPTP